MSGRLPCFREILSRIADHSLFHHDPLDDLIANINYINNYNNDNITNGNDNTSGNNNRNNRGNNNNNNSGNNNNNNNTDNNFIDTNIVQYRQCSTDVILPTIFIDVHLPDPGYVSTPIVPFICGSSLFYTVPPWTPLIRNPNMSHLVVGTLGPGRQNGWLLGPRQELYVLGRNQHYTADGLPVIVETCVLLTTTVWSTIMLNDSTDEPSGWLHLVTIAENGYLTRILDDVVETGAGDGAGPMGGGMVGGMGCGMVGGIGGAMGGGMGGAISGGMGNGMNLGTGYGMPWITNIIYAAGNGDVNDVLLYR